MNDEPIEQWRKEFHDKSPFHEIYMYMTDGEYDKMEVESYWQGFLAAKRAQPVVELPSKEYFVDGLEHKTIIKKDVIAALTAAGIKYTVKE